MSIGYLIQAFKWSMAAEIASKAIQPLIFILLARLVTPEDFGVMTAALMVIAFSQILWEAGMGKALIQRQTDVDAAANVAFWINIVLGGSMATILYLMASPVAHIFFQDSRVTLVLQVMTLQILFGSISAVHTALLQKEMGFKRLFWVRFATVTLPGLTAIPLALRGMGYWALVAGILLGQAVQVVMLWWSSPWRPSFSFDIPVFKEMVKFGSWVGLSGLLAWFYIWADSFIVGMYLGSHDLGLFRTGNQFVAMIFAFVFGPTIPVLYSHFVKMEGDKDRLGSAMERVIKVLIIISIPIAFTLFSLSEPIGECLFGEKWQGIGLVIRVMALMHGFSWIVGINGEAYRSIGKPFLEAGVMASSLIVYIPGYLISIKYGLDTFVWVRLVLAMWALMFHIILMKMVLSLSLGPLFKLFLIVVVIVIVITQVNGFVIKSLLFSDWQMVLAGMFLNMTSLPIALYYVERKGVIAELIRMYQSRNL